MIIWPALTERLREIARRLVEERATPEPNTGCLLWTGALEGKYAHRGEGYATAKTEFGKIKITRALLGLTDPEVHALHKCDVPACVNERHLYAGSNQQNAQDKVRAGRHHQQKRTTCKKGHPLDGSYLDHGARVRYCKTCQRVKNARRDPERLRRDARRYYAEHREEILQKLRGKKKNAR